MTQPAWLTVRQASDAFGISRRTIERRLSNGGIHQSQMRREGTERRILLAELIRVFGEPKNRPAAAGSTESVPADVPAPPPPQQVEDTARRLIERLEADLERERERADRYERELAEARKANADMVQRLLPAPRPAGLWARLFGR